MFKNWEGYLVDTVFVNQVAYIICMREGKNAKYFIVKPETKQCNVKLKSFDDVVLDKIKITYLPITSSTSTTSHKLQGTLNKLIVNLWRIPLYTLVICCSVKSKNT